MFLNRRDLDDGPKGFAILVSIGIPLLVSYQLCGKNLAFALAVTAVFWFSAARLLRAVGQRLDQRRSRRLEAAWLREEARRRRLGY